MKKKLFTTLLIASMAMTVLPRPVYATEVGVIGSAQEENNETSENVESDITYAEPGDAMSADEFFSSLNGGKESSTMEEGDIDVSGTGFLSVKINVSDDFFENIQLELYDRDTMEIVKVPVYASNEWTEKAEIPAGKYMVSNVIVGGDNPANPQWFFEMGEKVTVETNGEASLVIDLLRGPNFEKEDDSTEEEPTGEVTDTDNTKPNTQQEERTLGQVVKDFFLRLVTGANFVILTVLVGCSIAVWVIKKKREDN